MPRRPSKIDDAEFQKWVAALFVDGWSRKEMADELGVDSLDTITRWVRDPRIKAHTKRLIEDRTIRVQRRIDSLIEDRLTSANEIDTETLLKIRKEFTGGSTIKVEVGEATAETTHELMDELEKNPELAAAFKNLK